MNGTKNELSGTSHPRRSELNRDKETADIGRDDESKRETPEQVEQRARLTEEWLEKNSVNRDAVHTGTIK